MATHLSVNVNKIATLRNARGKNNPDLVKWCRAIEDVVAGETQSRVAGITVHPRPDQRHIRFQDVAKIQEVLRGELNIEGYPDDTWLKLVAKHKPAQATLVPDPPGVLTSNAGFKVSASRELLISSIDHIKSSSPKTRVSVFIDPEQFSKSDASELKRIGADRIELYTEQFALAFEAKDRKHLERVTERYRQASDLATEQGLEVNAGHDLNRENLGWFLHFVPNIKEVSIGHAIICEGLEHGLIATVEHYLKICAREIPFDLEGVISKLKQAEVKP